MPLKSPGISPDNEVPTRSYGASTPTKKRPDPIQGRQPDRFFTNGGKRDISDTELESWSKGKRV
jgi:hypothetical protein